MPTLVLATTSNPGTATWQDATTLPASSPWTALNVGVIVPPILAGQLWTTTVGGFTGIPAGRPVVIGWGNTATVIKVWAHMPSLGNVEIIIEADNSQSFAGGAVSFDIYALNV